jgi:flagellar biogenesis protein FliO
MKQDADGGAASEGWSAGGVAGWLLNRLRGARRGPPRLAVVERIALAPRQSLALVEAEGRRFLVATSNEGTPAFYALDEPLRDPLREPSRRSALTQALGLAAVQGRSRERSSTDRDARVSW